MTSITANREDALQDLIEASQLPESQDAERSRTLAEGGKTFLDFFNLNKHPFGDSLDTSFFYKTENHEEALIKMQMSIENDISFGLVTGKSGTGKTLLSQNLLESLAHYRFQPVLVPVSPGLSKGAFLKAILKEIDPEFDENTRDTAKMIEQVSECILSSYDSGIKPVFLIDEAHFLSPQALHVLRTLSNFESANKKLMTCILFAEDLFLRRLSNPSYASLKSRMYLHIQLSSLEFSEFKNYVEYRLMVSGNDSANVFSDEELEALYKKSTGTPRNINKECTNLMLEKFLKTRN